MREPLTNDLVRRTSSPQMSRKGGLLQPHRPPPMGGGGKGRSGNGVIISFAAHGGDAIFTLFECWKSSKYLAGRGYASWGMQKFLMTGMQWIGQENLARTRLHTLCIPKIGGMYVFFFAYNFRKFCGSQRIPKIEYSDNLSICHAILDFQMRHINQI